MIKLPLGTNRASEQTINSLIAIGALYVDETGLHASNAGSYPVKENIPAND